MTFNWRVVSEIKENPDVILLVLISLVVYQLDDTHCDNDFYSATYVMYCTKGM